MKTIGRIEKILLSRAFLWIAGFFAFIWIILRSGANPKRLAYPCQQTAFPIASTWAIAVLPFFPRIIKYIIKNRTYFIFIIGFMVLAGFAYKFHDNANVPEQVSDLPVWINENSISDIYLYENIPVSKGSLAAGDASVPNEYLSDPAIDSLVYMMSFGKTPFFKTVIDTNGIVGRDDIVLLKCNFQRRHRLGTNTDRIKGVIWQILNHPEGFKGEILVCDNEESQTSTASFLAGFNDYSNNSDDLEQSIVDVINTFKAKGYPIDYYAWDSLNTITVTEYNQGDLSDGYIFNQQTLTSYPKFQTSKGKYVSFKKGIWDNDFKKYNKENFTIINFPVLKAHGIAGATIALKNYIGVMNVTKEGRFRSFDDFHYNYCFSEYALVARELEIAWPDLNIIDATYVAIENNYDHRKKSVYQKTILASPDPVAASWYAAKYILTPVAKQPKLTNPDYINSKTNSYYTILGHWLNYLNDSTDFTVTKADSKISVYSLNNLPNSETSGTIENVLNNIRAFPNPFNERITISSNEFINNLLAVNVLDINGEIVYSKEIMSHDINIEINMDYLAPGNYIVKIIIANKNKSLVTKIVKN